MVPGVRVHGSTIADAEVSLDDLFRPVPVPTKFGVPLVYKMMPGTGGDDSHIRNSVIVRIMADPDDGFAPMEWQYGGDRGPAPPVFLARRDKLPFSKQDWDVMATYISDWLDQRCEDDGEEVSRRILTPEAFQNHVREHREQHPHAFLSLQFPLGSIVVPEGLAVAELNGVEGEVARYSRDRVGIQFPGRDVTALKPERLQLVKEAPAAIVEPAAKRQDTGDDKEKQLRTAHIAHQESLAIARRFVECLHQDTFPEMGDLHLFGVGCDYKARAQEVLGVWQGAAKSGDLTEDKLADALDKGTVKELFMETCHTIAKSRNPNSTYANELIKANFAALEWDDL